MRKILNLVLVFLLAIPLPAAPRANLPFKAKAAIDGIEACALAPHFLSEWIHRFQARFLSHRTFERSFVSLRDTPAHVRGGEPIQRALRAAQELPVTETIAVYQVLVALRDLPVALEKPDAWQERRYIDSLFDFIDSSAQQNTTVRQLIADLKLLTFRNQYMPAESAYRIPDLRAVPGDFLYDPDGLRELLDSVAERLPELYRKAGIEGLMKALQKAPQRYSYEAAVVGAQAKILGNASFKPMLAYYKELTDIDQMENIDWVIAKSGTDPAVRWLLSRYQLLKPGPKSALRQLQTFWVDTIDPSWKLQGALLFDGLVQRLVATRSPQVLPALLELLSPRLCQFLNLNISHHALEGVTELGGRSELTALATLIGHHRIHWQIRGEAMRVWTAIMERLSSSDRQTVLSTIDSAPFVAWAVDVISEHNSPMLPIRVLIAKGDETAIRTLFADPRLDPRMIQLAEWKLARQAMYEPNEVSREGKRILQVLGRKPDWPALKLSDGHVASFDDWHAIEERTSEYDTPRYDQPALLLHRTDPKLIAIRVERNNQATIYQLLHRDSVDSHEQLHLLLEYGQPYDLRNARSTRLACSLPAEWEPVVERYLLFVSERYLASLILSAGPWELEGWIPKEGTASYIHVQRAHYLPYYNREYAFDRHHKYGTSPFVNDIRYRREPDEEPAGLVVEKYRRVHHGESEGVRDGAIDAVVNRLAFAPYDITVQPKAMIRGQAQDDTVTLPFLPRAASLADILAGKVPPPSGVDLLASLEDLHRRLNEAYDRPMNQTFLEGLRHSHQKQGGRVLSIQDLANLNELVRNSVFVKDRLTVPSNLGPDNIVVEANGHMSLYNPGNPLWDVSPNDFEDLWSRHFDTEGEALLRLRTIQSESPVNRVFEISSHNFSYRFSERSEGIWKAEVLLTYYGAQFWHDLGNRATDLIQSILSAPHSPILLNPTEHAQRMWQSA